MTAVPPEPSTADLGGFTVEPEDVRPRPPSRRPRGITVAGVLMLGFAALIVVQLVLPLTPLLGYVRAPVYFFEVLNLDHEPTLIVVAIVVVVLSVAVLCGDHRGRFASVTVMGALVITEAIVMVRDGFGLVYAGFDRPIDVVIYQLNPAGAVGLVLAGTAFGLLAGRAATGWFEARQLARTPRPAVHPGQSSTRPVGLKLATVGLVVVVLYGLGLYLVRVVTVTGDAYVTREDYLISFTIYDLPPVLVLLAAVIGLVRGSSRGRMWGYAAAGWYCYEAVVAAMPLPIRVESITERLVLLVLTVIVGAIATAALFLLSRRDVTAWFHARRGDTSDVNSSISIR